MIAVLLSYLKYEFFERYLLKFKKISYLKYAK